MRKLACVAASIIAALHVIAAAAFPLSGPGAPDPLQITDVVQGGGLWANDAGYNDLNAFGARTLRTAPQINTGIKNLVLIIAGQSNGATEAPSAYVPTNGSAIDNLNIYDGGIYPWVDPPLGSTWAYQSFGGTGSTCATLQSCGHVGARIADIFISGNGTVPAGTFNRVIIAPVAVGGTSISQHSIGGPLYNRICQAMQRLANRGITPSVTNTTFAIVWVQGESDTGTTLAAYQAALNNIQAKAVSCGFSGRFFVNIQTWLSGTVNPTIQSAQSGIVDNTKFWAGFNADSLGSGNRIADNTHFNDSGVSALATGIANAMHASGAPFLWSPPFAVNDNWQALEGCNDNTSDFCKAM
ncbi:sialate O-acetylesterase [Bradyrhizobium sp. SZCCHNS3002]|uniref:sialate O-acetylesterase n=1 Tax=Bradyrhizobium sp. SZCCHNS3002 TaxID=3057310 RepID=UPI0028EDCDF8|nr:sialate O-acetylesterase [Bradyrhizobium sp. SZCCHNS3002]